MLHLRDKLLLQFLSFHRKLRLVHTRVSKRGNLVLVRLHKAQDGFPLFTAFVSCATQVAVHGLLCFRQITGRTRLVQRVVGHVCFEFRQFSQNLFLTESVTVVLRHAQLVGEGRFRGLHGVHVGAELRKFLAYVCQFVFRGLE